MAKGFVYRGKKPVYWSIPCRTALAEAEVEYHDHVSQSVFVKFPVVGRPKTFIVIWTTTPWTLPANLAVAYNEKLQYVTAKVGDENYIHVPRLAAGRRREMRLGRVTPRRHSRPDNSRRFNTSIRSAIAPARHLPLILSRATPAPVSFTSRPATVWMTTISAAKTVCRSIRPLTMTDGFAYSSELPVEQQMPAEMVGKSILEKHGKSDANEVVLHELRVRHALLHQENYHHSYPHCWRSKTPIIFRAMDQWFIKIDHVCSRRRRGKSQIRTGNSQSLITSTSTFRESALAEIDRVKWIPDWGVNRIKGAVQSRPDWCIQPPAHLGRADSRVL